MTRYWMLKDGSAVESHDDQTDISEIAAEITELEFRTFIDSMPPLDLPEKSDMEKLIEYAKAQGWI